MTELAQLNQCTMLLPVPARWKMQLGKWLPSTLMSLEVMTESAAVILFEGSGFLDGLVKRVVPSRNL